METNDELKQEKRMQFCARHGIEGEEVRCHIMMTPEFAERMVEVRKANPGKYTVVLPDGRIKYNDMQLLRDTGTTNNCAGKLLK